MLDSKVDICNLTLNLLGNSTDLISNIDTPTTDKEKTFALWYDTVRQALLRETIPSFSLGRAIVSKQSATPEFGYAYIYEAPSYSLRLLGIDNVEDKQNNYSVEDNTIVTDEDYTDGMKIRFVKDATDVTKFSPEFKLLMAYSLARFTCVPITGDTTKLASIKAELPSILASVCGINAQENKPIRISTSRFRLARDSGNPITQSKK